MRKIERKKGRLWILEHERDEWTHDDEREEGGSSYCCSNNKLCGTQIEKFIDEALETLEREKMRRKIFIQYPCGCLFLVYVFCERGKRETDFDHISDGEDCWRDGDDKDEKHVPNCDCIECEELRETESCVHGCDRKYCGICGDD